MFNSFNEYSSIHSGFNHKVIQDFEQQPLPKRHCVIPAFYPSPVLQSEQPSLLRQLLSAPPRPVIESGPVTVAQQGYAPHPIPYNGFQFVPRQQQGVPQLPTNCFMQIPHGYCPPVSNAKTVYKMVTVPIQMEQNRKRKACEIPVQHVPQQVSFPPTIWSKRHLVLLALLNLKDNTANIKSICHFLKTHFPSFDDNNANTKQCIKWQLDKPQLFEKIKTSGKRDLTYRLKDVSAARTEIIKELRKKKDYRIGMRYPELFSSLIDGVISTVTTNAPSVQQAVLPPQIMGSQAPRVLEQPSWKECYTFYEESIFHKDLEIEPIMNEQTSSYESEEVIEVVENEPGVVEGQGVDTFESLVRELVFEEEIMDQPGTSSTPPSFNTMNESISWKLPEDFSLTEFFDDNKCNTSDFDALTDWLMCTEKEDFVFDNIN